MRAETRGCPTHDWLSGAMSGILIENGETIRVSTFYTSDWSLYLLGGGWVRKHSFHGPFALNLRPK